jgi:hypothetical protein
MKWLNFSRSEMSLVSGWKHRARSFLRAGTTYSADSVETDYRRTPKPNALRITAWRPMRENHRDSVARDCLTQSSRPN